MKGFPSDNEQLFQELSNFHNLYQDMSKFLHNDIHEAVGYNNKPMFSKLRPRGSVVSLSDS